MNYCFVRRDAIVRKDGGGRPWSAGLEMSTHEATQERCRVSSEQTYRKEVVPVDNDVDSHSFRSRRIHSEPNAPDHDLIFNEDEEGNFDFFLAVAEADLVDFGFPFAKMVQQRMNMRPCLTVRHISIGQPKYESMAEFLETRCGGKVVFVVSRNFAASDECQFLVQFAKTLDPCAMEQKLIPLVIDKNVPVPRVLEGLSSINYNAALREKWLGKRLWEAIHGTQMAGKRRTLSSPSP